MRYIEREAAADEEAEITIETRREALVLARWFKKNASQLRRAIPERPLFSPAENLKSTSPRSLSGAHFTLMKHEPSAGCLILRLPHSMK